MHKGKTMAALCLAVLLAGASVTAEAACRLVDGQAGRRGQANIDSGTAYSSGAGADESDEGNGEQGSGNIIIFE